MRPCADNSATPPPTDRASECNKKRDKSFDLSRLVEQTINLSNPFLLDYELVVEFVNWIKNTTQSPPLITNVYSKK